MPRNQSGRPHKERFETGERLGRPSFGGQGIGQPEDDFGHPGVELERADKGIDRCEPRLEPGLGKGSGDPGLLRGKRLRTIEGRQRLATLTYLAPEEAEDVPQPRRGGFGAQPALDSRKRPSALSGLIADRASSNSASSPGNAALI